MSADHDPELIIPPSHPMAGKPGFQINKPLNPALDKRVAEWTPGNALQTAIKRALGLPVYVTIRYPLPGGKWLYGKKRIY